MAFLAVVLCVFLTIPHARASALPSSFVAEACKALQEQRGEPHCDPTKLYYSVLPNGERRFAEARRCALAQYAKALKLCPPKAQQRVCLRACFKDTEYPDDNPAVILANLYANGLGGAPRDLKLASIFAQQAFYEGNFDDFAELVKDFVHEANQGDKILPKYFDLYEESMSSVSFSMDKQDLGQMEFQAEVEAFLKRYQVTLPPASRKAFTRFREEFEHFQSHDCVTPFIAMAGNQSYGFSLSKERDEKEETLRILGCLVKRSCHSPVGFDRADKDLNAAYGRLRQELKEVKRRSSSLEMWTCEIGALTEAQRSWLRYRDAFAAFAQTLAPDQVNAVKARLTQYRAKELDDMWGSIGEQLAS
ncbi:lysozyme inhibitor LprI family protein [Acidithiobacillus caldus]|uniref:lysozyme inhibitor LprI family protein n=2 Tax=Acidithiobacillus caldus TaxID=33059 RepID=UPI001D012116|nr:lysozyme inhibitor LprI family protein [Acidithiobacillus caldus]